MPEGPGPNDDPETPLGRIQTDEEHGIRLLVEHPLETGRRRFSYVNGPDIASNRRRRNAVIRTLEEMGVEPRSANTSQASIGPNSTTLPISSLASGRTRSSATTTRWRCICSTRCGARTCPCQTTWPSPVSTAFLLPPSPIRV